MVCLFCSFLHWSFRVEYIKEKQCSWYPVQTF
jgi:hypothetical protein